jgi:transposase
VLVDLTALDLRTYIAEPDRGRRKWKKKADARDAVYANRRRIRGTRGRTLQRRRSERLERPNAHLYETGGMRRTHLRGHTNILKRLLVHIGGFNLGLLMRALIGVGTPRGLRGGWRHSSPSSRRCGHWSSTSASPSDAIRWSLG